MPELPEVQTIADDLDQALAGRAIEDVAIGYPRIVDGDAGEFRRLLAGQTLRGAGRVAKWVAVFFGPDKAGTVMMAHLKMTGQFHLGPWPATPGDFQPHDHVAFKIAGAPAGQEALLYRDIRKFGRLYAFPEKDLPAFKARRGLGPDPFQLDGEEFHRRLTAKKGRLKAVLLDQAVVSGLGNIYADESLFAAGLSPTAKASGLTEAETSRLLAKARAILTAAIAARGSTVNNYQGLSGPGAYQKQHQVYGREGQRCPVCGETIQKATVAGRGTHFCPRCQKVKI